jgi:hypothetical protein
VRPQNSSLRPFTQHFRQPLLIAFKLNQSLIQFLLSSGPRAIIPRFQIVDTDHHRYLFTRLMSNDESVKGSTPYLKLSDCSRDIPVVLLDPGNPLGFGGKQFHKCA